MLDQRLQLALPRLDQLTPAQVAIAGAVRRWVLARHMRRCPLQVAHERLGCAQAARALHLLLETVRSCWPEPFAISPPCCSVLSHDEATLLVMIDAAGARRRLAFDGLLCEMLGSDARDRLFAACATLARTLDG
jgi:hypothetical protein